MALAAASLAQESVRTFAVQWRVDVPVKLAYWASRLPGMAQVSFTCQQ